MSEPSFCQRTGSQWTEQSEELFSLDFPLIQPAASSRESVLSCLTPLLGQPEAKGSAAAHFSLPALEPDPAVQARLSSAFIPPLELSVYVNMPGSGLKV